MKRTNRKNKGVSTIIAAALLVAITVIIAVALGSTVLQAPTTGAPLQLQLEGWASKGDNEVRLRHIGGDPVSLEVITLQTYVPAGAYQGATYQVDISPYITYDPVTYAADPLTAGDTLTIPFDAAFQTNSYGSLSAPNVGEQFTVEIFYNGQPITAVTMVVLP